MKWILGLLGGGGIVVVVALLVLGPVRTLALARDIAGFFIDKARAVVKWAREPNRNWWKIGCFSFGGFFFVAALYANDQRQEVIYVTRTLTEEIRICGNRAEEAERTSKKNADAFSQCQAQLATVTGEDVDVDLQTQAALAAAEAGKREAERKLEEWKKRERTLECVDALNILEQRCATFSDY